MSVPLEVLGTYSLELYLLQFHIFLTRKASHVLMILPNHKLKLLNSLFTGALYFFAAQECFHSTAALNKLVFQVKCRMAFLVAPAAAVVSVSAYLMVDVCAVSWYFLLVVVCMSGLLHIAGKFAYFSSKHVCCVYSAQSAQISKS